MKIPSLHINDKGEAEFNNGRHRFAVIRDSGATHIPVSLDTKEAYNNAKKHGYI